jgi:hypothetical protein
MLKVATPLSDAEEAIVSACLGCGIAVHLLLNFNTTLLKSQMRRVVR